jgi:hypothetical protein
MLGLQLLHHAHIMQDFICNEHGQEVLLYVGTGRSCAQRADDDVLNVWQVPDLPIVATHNVSAVVAAAEVVPHPA